MKNNSDSNETKLAAACILLSVADADEILEERELILIADILKDFFSIDSKEVSSIIEKAQIEWKNSTGLFHYGEELNNNFNKDDKIDFISCILEVAYADGDLHYLEHHTIKKIANILNLHRDTIITAKKEIEKYWD